MNRKSTWGAAVVIVTFAAVGGVAVSKQDKYAVRLPGGLAFSDFKGYEDWELISSAKTDDRMKVILGNPTIIAAYKSGVPGNGKAFPEGSKIAKLQWKPKKSTEAPFSVDVPDTLADLFFMEKDSKRFPDTGGWGYAQFDYDPGVGHLHSRQGWYADLRPELPCGREVQGLRLPPVRTAVTEAPSC